MAVARFVVVGAILAAGKGVRVAIASMVRSLTNTLKQIPAAWLEFKITHSLLLVDSRFSTGLEFQTSQAEVPRGRGFSTESTH
jgi:hypothetical protein